ncbi:DUF4258 domain-containing protein [Alicyclobacillus hesperidum]|uniref:DUF4258 domain-containing protein n=1 Tax=Alicyclobacillus hesperidum TaxID=89784 RepID=UPI0002E7159F|nr:DUF4258 domain-containing protein [Alicyclobacillus hesperidum]
MEKSGRAYEQYWGLLKNVLLQHLEHNLVIFTDHAKERMKDRGIPEEIVKLAIRDGRLSEMHKPFSYPFGEHPFQNRDPVFTIVGRSTNMQSPIAVALAISKVRGEAEFAVVTMLDDITHSRHRHYDQ